MADDITIQVGIALRNFLSGIEEAKSSLKGLAEAFIVAFSVKEIADFVDNTAKVATHVENLSAQLGASSEVIQQMGVMSKAAGGDVDTLANMINRMEVGMIRGQKATSQQAAAAKALGINIKEFIAAEPQEKILLMADALQKFADGGTKTADVMMLAGRGAAQNIAFFNQGRAAILAWNAAMKEQNAIVDEASNTILAQLDRNIVLATSSWHALTSEIVAKFSPGITGLITALANMGKALANSAKDGGTLDTIIRGLDGAFIAFDVALVTATTAIQLMWETTKTVVFTIGEAFMALARVIKDALTFNWSDISAAWDNLQAQVHARITNVAADMVSTMAKAKDDIMKILAGVGNAPPGGGPTSGNQAPAADLGAGAAMRLQMQLAQTAYQAEVQRIDGLRDLYEITENQKTQMLKAAIQTRAAAEIQAGENATLAWQKAGRDIERNNTELTKKISQEWKSVADTIAGAFNSQLDAILSGTETFAEGMKKAFASMVLDMIKSLVKLFTEWLMLNAISVAMGGGPIPFSAVMPTLGKFAEGTPYVPSTGLALIHEGEAIIPANINPFSATSSMRDLIGGAGGAGGVGGVGGVGGAGGDGSMGGGGGFSTIRMGGGGSFATNVHFNVNAVDARSFANMLMNNQSALSLALRAMQRRNFTTFAQATQASR